MEDEYDETRPSNYISYLDANNLYGLAMSMKLPIGELKWIKKLLNEKMITDWNENDDFAYILDVDLEYPKEIQDEQSDYPLAPENMKVEEKYYQNIRGNYTDTTTMVKKPRMRNNQS